MTERLRIGTRRSALAMWQTEWVAALLAEQCPKIEVEIVSLETLGDRDKSTSLVGLNRVGVFTKEIEDALLDGRCDVAVHSYKDMATVLPDGLVVGATLEREDPRDAFVSRSGAPLEEIPAGSVIGTSSLRRRAMVLRSRPDCAIAGLRGNVPTRLKAAGVDVEGARPLTGDPIDATVMALAGLKRLGLERHATQLLDPDIFVPAPAQGVVAVQVRADDSLAVEAARALDHERTRRESDAERTFLRTMEGGCHMPLGAIARDMGGALSLTGEVLSLDGKRAVKATMEGADPVRLGEDLATRMKEEGADEILRDVAAGGTGGAG